MYARNLQSGFTLIELVTTILIVGILAVFAIPKFIGTSSVEPQTAQHLVLTAARRAQQLAMNKGAAALVQLSTDNTNNRIRISYTDGGLQNIDFDIPTSVSMNGGMDQTFNYDALGNATPAATISLTSGRDVCIEATGYAHPC
jgi:MSHA pilin protein MshC